MPHAWRRCVLASVRACIRGWPTKRAYRGSGRKDLDDLVEQSWVACHRWGCQAPATKVYTAMRGAAPYRYQRCEAHPIANAMSVEPFDGGASRGAQ
jgi:hypothetical protein